MSASVSSAPVSPHTAYRQAGIEMFESAKHRLADLAKLSPDELAGRSGDADYTRSLLNSARVKFAAGTANLAIVRTVPEGFDLVPNALDALSYSVGHSHKIDNVFDPMARGIVTNALERATQAIRLLRR